MERRIAVGCVLALGFALSLPASAPAGELNPFFRDGFEAGHMGNWSQDVGNICPEIPGLPEYFTSAAMYNSSPNRIIVYERVSDWVDTVYGRALFLEIYESVGGPLGPATIDLGAGIETNYATCGTCVLLHLNYDTADGSYDRAFFQKSGSVIISDLTPADGETFSASIAVTLEEVVIEPGPSYLSTPVPGGCVIPDVHIVFSMALQDLG